MQIVIDIPEEEYKCVQITGCIGNKTCISNAIYNSTPLPKGHGPLIDKGKFRRWIEIQDGDKLMTEYYLDALDMQETIVGGSHDGDID